MSFCAESGFPPPQSEDGKDRGGGHFGRVRQSLRSFEYANESTLEPACKVRVLSKES